MGGAFRQGRKVLAAPVGVGVRRAVRGPCGPLVTLAYGQPDADPAAGRPRLVSRMCVDTEVLCSLLMPRGLLPP